MSTLHAALAALADEWEAEDSTDAPTGDRTAELRDLLAAHPAPEAGEVRLTEEEREEVRRMAYAGSYSREKADRYVRTVERILAARLAEVAQPAGETRVEWGVRWDDGTETSAGWMPDISERMARRTMAGVEKAMVVQPRKPVELLSRIRTSFPDVVGEWEVAGDE